MTGAQAAAKEASLHWSSSGKAGKSSPGSSHEMPPMANIPQKVLAVSMRWGHQRPPWRGFMSWEPQGQAEGCVPCASPLRTPAKLLQEQGAGTDTGTLSSRTSVVGLVSPGSELEYGNLLISEGDGVLTEEPRWTAAVLLYAGFWLTWPQDSQGYGLHSTRAASTMPEPTHCPCQCLDVSSQGQAKPGLALPWLFSRECR